ncbi:MAG TPA: hypothetical protein VG897_19325 [Terriglobales bacterium]|nr:hypothetical protein [Terriglobales bacterium]
MIEFQDGTLLIDGSLDLIYDIRRAIDRDPLPVSRRREQFRVFGLEHSLVSFNLDSHPHLQSAGCLPLQLAMRRR